MKEGRASRTAEGAAAARALHTALDANPVISDPYAVHLTSRTWRLLITTPLLNLLVQRVFMRRLQSVAGQVISRCRYAEDCLDAARQDGITQYVIVGAGFDSFALRRPDAQSSLRIIEMDHPDTQATKLARLRRLSEPPPANVEYVAVNFERETLGAALQRCSFDATAPAFFSWLGTTPYLTHSATLGTLEAIASSAAPGSEVVFDYLIPLDEVDAAERAVMARLKAFTDRRGEPLIGEFSPTALWHSLSAIGFEKVNDLSREDQRQRYFADRDDGLAPMAASHLAHARLPRRRD